LPDNVPVIIYLLLFIYYYLSLLLLQINTTKTLPALVKQKDTYQCHANNSQTFTYNLLEKRSQYNNLISFLCTGLPKLWAKRARFHL